ncbi:hypothetical protein DIPPA_03794 [Diplonema papillatum]|nr:hypothetical protein DIPPA_03794 [Diplonema papillatum]
MKVNIVPRSVTSDARSVSFSGDIRNGQRPSPVVRPSRKRRKSSQNFDILALFPPKPKKKRIQPLRAGDDSDEVRPVGSGRDAATAQHPPPQQQTSREKGAPRDLQDLLAAISGAGHADGAGAQTKRPEGKKRRGDVKPISTVAVVPADLQRSKALAARAHEPPRNQYADGQFQELGPAAPILDDSPLPSPHRMHALDPMDPLLLSPDGPLSAYDAGRDSLSFADSIALPARGQISPGSDRAPSGQANHASNADFLANLCETDSDAVFRRAFRGDDVPSESLPFGSARGPPAPAHSAWL